jgi:hypothetical protein
MRGKSPCYRGRIPDEGNNPAHSSGDVHLPEHLGDVLVLNVVELVEVAAYLLLYLASFLGRGEEQWLWDDEVEVVTEGPAVPLSYVHLLTTRVWALTMISWRARWPSCA